MDLTAPTTVQRERWEDDAADVVSELLRLVQDSLVVRFRLVRIVEAVLQLSLWFMRNIDARILSLNQNRSSSGLDGFAKVVVKRWFQLRHSVDWSGTVSNPIPSLSFG